MLCRMRVFEPKCGNSSKLFEMMKYVIADLKKNQLEIPTVKKKRITEIAVFSTQLCMAKENIDKLENVKMFLVNII